MERIIATIGSPYNVAEMVEGWGKDETEHTRKQVSKAEAQTQNRMEMDTVHKYQGREKSVMVFSTVLDSSAKGRSGLNFVDNAQLVNVAISRAVDQFVLITDEKAFSKHGTNIGDLIRYMEYNCVEEANVQSDLTSVFDLLYQEYLSKPLAIKNKTKNISKYKSECYMNTVIEQVLEDEQYQCFSYRFSVRLKEVLRHNEYLSETERIFVGRPRSSIDFAIYNRFDFVPVLAVEVDGFEFHENNPEQLERDRMKDAILKKYGIPVLRLETNGSAEEKRLRAMLNEVLQQA